MDIVLIVAHHFMERSKAHLPHRQLANKQPRTPSTWGTGYPTKSRTPGKSVPPASLAPVRANTSLRSGKVSASHIPAECRESRPHPHKQKSPRVSRGPAAQPATSQTHRSRTPCRPHRHARKPPRDSRPAASAPQRSEERRV